MKKFLLCGFLLLFTTPISTAQTYPNTTSRIEYLEPKKPSLPNYKVQIDISTTALVVTDPQIDFLSPKGAAYGAVGKSVEEHNVVEHLDALFRSSLDARMNIFISPHYYFRHDHDWHFKGSLEKLMHSVRMVERDKIDASLPAINKGADWLPQYKPYINDSSTIITSPHKIYGPEQNDLVLQLRKRGINTVILAGMSANLCVQGHLHELIEQGFEVIVVKDATAGAILPEGDGYLAALVGFRFIANEVVSTSEILTRIAEASELQASSTP